MEHIISKSTLSLVLSKIINGAELLIKDELESFNGKLFGINFEVIDNKIVCYAEYKTDKDIFGYVDITPYLPDEFDFTKSAKVEFKEMIKQKLKDKKHVD